MRGVRLIWPDGVVPALRPDDPGVPGLVLGVLGVLGMNGVAGAVGGCTVGNPSQLGTMSARG